MDPEDLVNNLSLLFQHTYAERMAILTHFELPASIHTTLAGSLCVLRYFLENSPISGTIIDGASSSLLNMEKQERQQLQLQQQPRTMSSSSRQLQQQTKSSIASSYFSPLDEYYNEDEDVIDYTSDQDNFFVVDNDDDDDSHLDTGGDGLHDRPRHLVDGLVYQALFPIIAQWWTHCHSPQETDLMTTDDQLVWNAYKDVLLWVRHQTCLSTQQHDLATSPYAQHLALSTSSAVVDGDSSFDKDDITLDDAVIPSMKLYNSFTSRSLLALRSLVRYESIRCYLIHQLHFIELMIYMFQHQPSLTDHVLTCLGLMVQSGTSIPENTLQRCVVVIWKYLLDPSQPQQNKKTFWFYTRLILTCVSRLKGDKSTTKIGGVELDLLKSTSFCLINQETCLEVRNDSWTFETVTCTHAAMMINDNNKNKVCYQVILKTDGLNQMGWINYQCQLDAEAGSGVGDDEYSYGYDGCRCKKWHGRHRMRKTNYGKTWQVGDVITCALDLDRGEIKYYQNGDDLGVAFTKVDPTQHWYPAVSLSTGQECEFLFGGPMDPLRDGPDGYQSIYEFHFTPETVENAELMEDLAEAMQRMRVSSPPSLTPSPSLGLLAASTSIVTNGIPLAQQQSTSLHSLYVEMTVAYRPINTASVAMNTMMFGWKNAYLSSASTSVYLDYNRITQQGRICCDGQDLLPTSFTMHLLEGDLIGLFFDQQQLHFGFTLNGELLALVRLDGPFLPYVPYTMGSVKTKTNYGQHTFRYGPSSDQQRKSMMMYLDQLMTSNQA
ncbi:SPRY domain-domain-containing protein [Absidia repens]|uniref:SPRY domain-domain-containing protein n=1 Tax=Absidia repens TaxID=90262 RepID=A0A1X2J253_9FUNG|nr:SPRY domain-domain-containing protein [Absidia repens]